MKLGGVWVRSKQAKAVAATILGCRRGWHPCHLEQLTLIRVRRKIQHARVFIRSLRRAGSHGSTAGKDARRYNKETGGVASAGFALQMFAYDNSTEP
jgi:hypothetical protein